MTTALTTTPSHNLAGKALGLHSEFAAFKRQIAALGKKKKIGPWQVLVGSRYHRFQREADNRKDQRSARP
jgi:hypothetical protein